MSAVHYSIAEPSVAGRVRARCGLFTKSFTSDAAKVTCIACRRLLNPKNKKPMTTRTTLTSTLLSFFVLAACNDVDPSDYDSTGDTTGEPATSISHPDTGDGFSSTNSAGSASTSGEESSSGSESSTGDAATDGGTDSGTEPAICYGASCDDDPCSPGLDCAVNPMTGSRVCVIPCTTGVCHDLAGCGEAMPTVECVATVGATSFCFPVVCEVDENCNGGTCVGGTCF